MSPGFMDKFRGSIQVTKMTESDIELMAIEQLEGNGLYIDLHPESWTLLV